MERHLALEEEKLFPAFEEATGMAGAGPTQTMRIEHEQMRRLLEEMKQAPGRAKARSISASRKRCLF